VTGVPASERARSEADEDDRYGRAMERRIDLSNLDLDRAASIIAERRSRWMALGITVGDVTWMDSAAAWPRPLLTARDQARRPMSLGIRLRRGEGEAEVVLYAGGWADADYLPADRQEVTSEYVELDHADEFGPLLNRIVAALTGA
jgi:hypothetical protein